MKAIMRRSPILFLMLFIVFTFSSVAHAGPVLTLQGKYSSILEGGTNKLNYVELPDNKFYRWESPPGYSRYFREGIEIIVRGEELQPGYLQAQSVNIAPRFEFVSGPKNIAVIVSKWSDEPETPELADRLNRAKRFYSTTKPDPVGRVFEKISNGVVSVSMDVYGIFSIDRTVPFDGCPGENPALFELTAQQFGLSDTQYDHIVISYPKEGRCVSLGKGSIRRKEVYLNTDYVFSSAELENEIARALVHETLHNMGLYHASAYYCRNIPSTSQRECQLSEYGDPTSIQGSSNKDINAAEKYLLGWLSPSQVLTVSSPGVYELGTLDTLSPLPRALKILPDAPITPTDLGMRVQWSSVTDPFLGNLPEPFQEYDYWVSYAPNAAITEPTPQSAEIHLVARYPKSLDPLTYGNTLHLQSLNSGSSYEDKFKNGIKVIPLGMRKRNQETVMGIQVCFPGTQCPEPEFAPQLNFRLLPLVMKVGKKFNRKLVPTRGSGITSCTLTGKLPRELKFKPKPCKLFGKPKSKTKPRELVIEAQGPNGFDSARITITVKKVKKKSLRKS